MTFKDDIAEVISQLSPAAQFKIVILFVLILLLFAPVLFGLINIWYTSPDYSHGFFVLPIVIFMLWRKRHQLVDLEYSGVWSAFPVLFVAAFSYTISLVANFHTLTYVSMTIILLSLVLFVSGWQILRIIFLSLLFLVFMFPIPNSIYILITNPLKLLITSISAEIINLFGIPVYQDGNLLFFASTRLEVAEACSGVRSLYSYIMLSCVMALRCRNMSSKTILILSTIPLAILVNILRVSGTGILSSFYGPQVAQGFFHEFTGFVLFIIGLIVLSALYYLLEHSAIQRFCGGDG